MRCKCLGVRLWYNERKACLQSSSGDKTNYQDIEQRQENHCKNTQFLKVWWRLMHNQRVVTYLICWHSTTKSNSNEQHFEIQDKFALSVDWELLYSCCSESIQAAALENKKMLHHRGPLFTLFVCFLLFCQFYVFWKEGPRISKCVARIQASTG